MDGVIADLYGYLRSEENDPNIDIDYALEKRIGTSLFSDIPLAPYALELVEFVDNLTDGDWKILSAPYDLDFHNSIIHKQLWLKKNKIKPKSCIFCIAKYIHSMPGRILIDDKFHLNLEPWEKRGGVGIHYIADAYDRIEFLEKLEQIEEKWLTLKLSGV